MLIGQILEKQHQNVTYILKQFKDKFTETVDEIKDKERKWFDNMMDNFVKNPL